MTNTRLPKRRNISGGSPFEDVIGYSRVVDDGSYVFVSGTAGFDYEQGTISDDLKEQVHQTFRNIKSYLELAGCQLSDIVKTTYIVAKASDWHKVAPIIGDYMRDVKPAATGFVSKLVDPRMKVEIEVMARRSEN